MRTFYESRGVNVIHDPSQETTDFGKSMEFIAKHDPESSYIGEQEVPHPKMTVVAIGGIGGRVDQSFHSVSFPWYIAEGMVVLIRARSIRCIKRRTRAEG